MEQLFTLEQLEYLDKHNDQRYVQITTCNETQDAVSKRFAKDDTRIQLFEQKMRTWEWMFKLIATGTVGTLISSLLTLILK